MHIVHIIYIFYEIHDSKHSDNNITNRHYVNTPVGCLLTMQQLAVVLTSHQWPVFRQYFLIKTHTYQQQHRLRMGCKTYISYCSQQYPSRSTSHNPMYINSACVLNHSGPLTVIYYQ